MTLEKIIQDLTNNPETWEFSMDFMPIYKSKLTGLICGGATVDVFKKGNIYISVNSTGVATLCINNVDLPLGTPDNVALLVEAAKTAASSRNRMTDEELVRREKSIKKLEAGLKQATFNNSNV